MKTLKVRSGVEVTGGRPIGVVYLVDRLGPLVERSYALTVGGALELAGLIREAGGLGHDPVRVRGQDRDAAKVELTLPLGCAARAQATIVRFAEQARLRAAAPPCTEIL